jgi:hypothetical protein
LGKGAEEWRAETKRCEHAQEENDVSRQSNENCRSATGEMGEDQSSAEIVPKDASTRHTLGFFDAALAALVSSVREDESH